MSLQNTGRFLAPLEKGSTSSGGLLPLTPIESVRNRRFEITNIPSNMSTKASSQIGLSIKMDNRLEPLAKNLENSNSMFKGGFTLSGKGSMFLKSNTNKQIEASEISDIDLKSDQLASNSNGNNVKSILRDSSLTDVRTRPDKQSDAEDDKKSVRFNLNEPTKMSTCKNIACSSDNSSNDDDDEKEWNFDNEADGVETHVKEITMTINRTSLQQNDKRAYEEIETTAPSLPKNLTTLFDQSSDSGRIRPMYEDTDSESVTSIKSVNNYDDDDKEDDKEMKRIDLPKPITQRLKVFELQDQYNEISQNDKNLFVNKKSVDLHHDFDIKWQEEKTKFEKIIIEKRNALEKEHQTLLKALEKELKEKRNDRKIELESQHNVEVEKFKQQLKEEFEEKRKILNQEHRLAEEKLQENHKIIIQELERDLKTEEELIKKDYAINLQKTKDKMSHDLDLERQKMRESGESNLYEKIRCEKRLLEDKYRCLKDKYVRLKTDVKISLERRHQRREQQSLTTTGSEEIERSNSNKQSNEVRSSSISVTGSTGKPPPLSTQRKEITDKSEERDRSTNFFNERPNKKVAVAAKYLSHVQSQLCPDDTSIRYVSVITKL